MSSERSWRREIDETVAIQVRARIAPGLSPAGGAAVRPAHRRAASEEATRSSTGSAIAASLRPSRFHVGEARARPDAAGVESPLGRELPVPATIRMERSRSAVATTRSFRPSPSTSPAPRRPDRPPPCGPCSGRSHRPCASGIAASITPIASARTARRRPTRLRRVRHSSCSCLVIVVSGLVPATRTPRSGRASPHLPGAPPCQAPLA